MAEEGTDVIKFGKHKGKKLSDPAVPASWLDWILDQEWPHDDFKELVADELAVRNQGE